MYQHISYVIRYFLCVESFESEGRVCLEGEIYPVYYIDDYLKLVFENGEMNFTKEFFERVIVVWADMLVEITP